MRHQNAKTLRESRAARAACRQQAISHHARARGDIQPADTTDRTAPIN
jgi:hypothetical protein